MSQPLIDLADVRLTLGQGDVRTEILKGVSLRLDPGESVAVLGPSGSGKSSLMAIVAGLERADAGSVSLAGQDIGGLNEDALARLRGRSLGIILQAFHLLPTMTALENVAVPLELAGVDDAHDRARAELDAVGLGHRLAHYPAQLSGGEQQRVAIARATAPRPQLLLADEPTGNVDPPMAKRLLNLFLELNRLGTAVVIATHDFGLMDQIDARRMILTEGRLDIYE
jgi:putative ABC transport system ATP-binding protein